MLLVSVTHPRKITRARKLNFEIEAVTENYKKSKCRATEDYCLLTNSSWLFKFAFLHNMGPYALGCHCS